MAKLQRIRANDGASTALVPYGVGAHPLQRAAMNDTLLNLVTGMGTDKDKLTSTMFQYGEMGKQQLEAAYRSDWISRKVTDIPAYDSFREWRVWEADKNDLTAIETVEKSMHIKRKSMLALQRGRLYGGGALIMGVDQGTSDEPLDFDKLGKDCLQFVHAVNKYQLSGGPIDWDVMSPYYGTPSYFTVSGQGQNSALKIHPSRVIRFCGNEAPDPLVTDGWGDSVLQVCADAILACGTVSASIATLVAEAKIDVVGMPELSEKIMNKDYEDRLKKRFGLAATMKSVYNILIVDAAEEWQRLQANFTGFPDILKMYLLIASGAADIPATRFLGQSPTGLSATGESDTRNYYDRIATEQSTMISPNMEPLDKVILASALGKIPEEMFYEWEPLWQMTEVEKSTVAKNKSDVMTADVNAGLITPVVLQKARENQLIEDGTYPGLEQLIEEFGDDIDEREENADPALDPQIDPKTGLPMPMPAPAAGAVGGGAAAKSAKAPPTSANPAPRAANSNARPAKAAANDSADMLQRIKANDASTPRTLYMRRDVINAKAIKAWYKKQGFASTLSDMHVTIAYSKKPIDWLKVGSEPWGQDENGNLTIKAGGPRVIEAFGKAIVMAFSCSDLAYRNRSIINQADASWDYDDYTPHITISYNLPSKQLMEVEAYQGEIVLGPEIWEEIDTSFDNNTMVVEDGELLPDMWLDTLHQPSGKFASKAEKLARSSQGLYPSGFHYAEGVSARRIAATEDRIAAHAARSKEGLSPRDKWAIALECAYLDDEEEEDHNPNHDPDNGQFSEGGGGGKSAKLEAKALKHGKNVKKSESRLAQLEAKLAAIRARQHPSFKK